MGRALQLYNIEWWYSADPPPSRALQPLGPAPAGLFLGPAPPRPSLSNSVLMATELSTTTLTLCSQKCWAGHLAYLASLGHRLLSALQVDRFLLTAAHSPCSHPHMSLFTDALTHSSLCVLTAHPVCVWEQVDRAASYSSAILDLFIDI